MGRIMLLAVVVLLVLAVGGAGAFLASGKGLDLSSFTAWFGKGDGGEVEDAGVVHLFKAANKVTGEGVGAVCLDENGREMILEEGVFSLFHFPVGQHVLYCRNGLSYTKAYVFVDSLENSRHLINLMPLAAVSYNVIGSLARDGGLVVSLKSVGGIFELARVCEHHSPSVLKVDLDGAALAEAPSRLDGVVDKCWKVEHTLAVAEVFDLVFDVDVLEGSDGAYVEFFIIDRDRREGNGFRFDVELPGGADVGLPDVLIKKL